MRFIGAFFGVLGIFGGLVVKITTRLTPFTIGTGSHDGHYSRSAQRRWNGDIHRADSYQARRRASLSGEHKFQPEKGR